MPAIRNHVRRPDSNFECAAVGRFGLAGHHLHGLGPSHRGPRASPASSGSPGAPLAAARRAWRRRARPPGARRPARGPAGRPVPALRRSASIDSSSRLRSSPRSRVSCASLMSCGGSDQLGDAPVELLLAGIVVRQPEDRAPVVLPLPRRHLPARGSEVVEREGGLQRAPVGLHPGDGLTVEGDGGVDRAGAVLAQRHVDVGIDLAAGEHEQAGDERRTRESASAPRLIIGSERVRNRRRDEPARPQGSTCGSRRTRTRTNWRDQRVHDPAAHASSLRCCYSGVPLPASSTGGGSTPSIERNTISSSSASITIVSPARNSFQRIFSESGSSTMRWIARRNGRAPSAGS